MNDKFIGLEHSDIYRTIKAGKSHISKITHSTTMALQYILALSCNARLSERSI